MQADGIKFFHSFRLPNGEIIQGAKSYEHLRAEAELTFRHVDVVGKSVLDIGAWDGFLSFEAERRGASRVMATDHFCWSGEGWGTKAGFDYVHNATGSKVESVDIDVHGLDPKKLGTFDIVLFLGVLYHLKDPFIGLEKAAAMCSDVLVVETASDMSDVSEPVMRYYLRGELNGDNSNFWAPNVPCLTDMLKELGFRRFEHQLANDRKRSRVTMHAWRK